MYRLGLFAVVSCLKKESYTVPPKGLSLKLNTDPRICLTYLPGCFATPVIAHTMVGKQPGSPGHRHGRRLVQEGPWRRVQSHSGASPTPQVQPLDTALLSAAKSGTDAFHSVVSTSPVVYLTHPSSQPLRRPLTLTLPCPPNPQKNQGGRQEEPRKDQTQKGKSQGR